MTNFYREALTDLAAVFDRIDDDQVARAVDEIARARKIVLYGLGREGLQIKGFAMRLFHLGLNVAVVGDMTAPPVGHGDLLILSSGPGSFSTVNALMGVAKEAGVRTLVVTAQPDQADPRAADVVLVLPAQTMANDQGQRVSVLPMGSLFEGAQYILFEGMILALREKLNISAEAMRANHTNLE